MVSEISSSRINPGSRAAVLNALIRGRASTARASALRHSSERRPKSRTKGGYKKRQTRIPAPAETPAIHNAGFRDFNSSALLIQPAFQFKFAAPFSGLFARGHQFYIFKGSLLQLGNKIGKDRLFCFRGKGPL